MGRGRAKAKQTKVARDLKYRPVSTDFASLERELRGTSEVDIADIPDAYADLAAQYVVDDDDFIVEDDDDDEFDDDDDDEGPRPPV
ncbi:MAG TPA: DUF3073 domain-containing protein [Propionibacteriaceae bacterium]|nr:DUF3073 domain-containing protein [Propionibacteriaceae bacterium]